MGDRTKTAATPTMYGRQSAAATGWMASWLDGSKSVCAPTHLLGKLGHICAKLVTQLAGVAKADIVGSSCRGQGWAGPAPAQSRCIQVSW
jgi:hypothetical protein